MYQGSCHCGQTRFTLNAPALGPVAECNCSHCQRKGYLLSFHDRALLHIQAGEGELASYSFHKHVIAHKFCPRCGCAPFGLGRAPDGTELAAINVRCLEGVDLASLVRTPVDGLAF